MWTRMMLLAILASSSLDCVMTADESRPAEVKVAVVQILGYDKTDVPRPGFDPSEKVVSYLEKAADDGAKLVAFPEYVLGHISVPGPQTARISSAVSSKRVYAIVGCWEALRDGSSPRKVVQQSGAGHLSPEQSKY